jgi:hypothetical protein
LQQFAATDTPAALEETVNEGNRGCEVALLNVLAKLSHVTEATKLRRGELLTKAAVVSLARQIVETLTNRVAGKFPGWELPLDDVQREILTIFTEAKNPELLEK